MSEPVMDWTEFEPDVVVSTGPDGCALDGCQYCGEPFDVIATRYLCPNCKTKNTCCEGVCPRR